MQSVRYFRPILTKSGVFRPQYQISQKYKPPLHADEWTDEWSDGRSDGRSDRRTDVMNGES